MYLRHPPALEPTIMHRCSRLASFCFVFVLLLVGSQRPAAADDHVLLTVGPDTDLSAIETRDVQLSIADHEGQPVLRLEAGHQQRWPGITVVPAQDRWDLTEREAVSVVVRNTGEHPLRFGLRADSPNIDGQQQYIQVVEDVPEGQQKTVRLPLTRRAPAALRDKLFGMRGYPGQMNPDQGIDASQVTAILCFVSQPDRDHTLELSQLRATGELEDSIWLTAEPETLFPMIDRFGQYKHRTWPGKVSDEQDLQQRIAIEDRDLAEHVGPDGLTQYGGWLDGPELEATGRFRVTNRDGKWWLVDPEGRLFWSYGIDCVRWTTGTTPITDREFYFADLPAKDSPLAVFYGRGSWAPHGYYHNRGTYRTFNFTGSNLARKYGESWRQTFQQRSHQRLRSWGLNTIGNWSDPEIYGTAQTPYVVTVNSGRLPIEGSSGYWGQFPDPFDPSFRETTERNMAAQQQAANSPWCLGVFVDNELSWGEEVSLAVATLESPAKQAAKQAFIADLQEKYESIERLNDTWGTDHRSWEALSEHQQPPPDRQRALADLQAFATRIADRYFDVCRQAVKKYAPDTLYLGCRFAWVNDRAVQSAAKYCDVISYNLYRESVARFRLPAALDAPVIIGEFHFGALDRGMFHTGLRATANQQGRAAAYLNYVRGAVENPQLVGTHWFQFGDQATTGRGDGENYQIGFLDICDTPYPEIIAASRDVGRHMYRWR